MKEKTRTGLEILQAAVLLGVLADVLLKRTPWGLNALLFIGALVAAMAMLVRRHNKDFFGAQTVALNGALVFFAGCYVWRDSSELKIFDFLAVVTILAVLTLPALKIKLAAAGLFHYLIGFVWSGVNAAVAPFVLFFGDVQWKSVPQTAGRKHLLAALRGLLIAAPLLLVFGALFAAADTAFERLVGRVFSVAPETVFEHVFFIGFFTWIVAGYLRGSLIGSFFVDSQKTNSETNGEIVPQVGSVTEIKSEEPTKSEDKPKEEKKPWNWRELDNSILPAGLTLGAVEVSIILGLLNLLFLSFVVMQVPYLFGGFELVQNTPDFKLSEYARRGFGELILVAALVLPVLLAGDWLRRRDDPLNEKIYRALAAVQIALLFVIMASAAQRLFILTGNLGYGLTTARFYPMIFMLWLGVVFLLFAATVLRGARHLFASCALWSAFLILGALHAFNPDAYIVRTNVRLWQEGRAFDVYYNANLSDDAVPALIESLPAMSAEAQCVVRRQLSERLKESDEENDFRSWNLSRRAARLASVEALPNSDQNHCLK